MKLLGFSIVLFYCILAVYCQQLDKWSEWNDWTACSRSCGGGVSYQVRKCLNSTGGIGTSCDGPNRRNRMCNIQDCPEGSKDFRAVQCAAYNSKKYKGKYFKWVPWPQAAFPCELSCMPKGQRFYVRLASKVQDGTKCHQGSLDTCIDGKCESVGCDLILNSKAKFDNCRECNGNNDRCKPVRGNFVLKDFEPDYVEMITIPARSTTIYITEEGRPRNYLAVKDYKGDYIFNGDWVINNPGEYKLNGHYATYHRSSKGQSVSINGPIDAPITIEVLAYSKPVNFSYEYYTPNGMTNGILKTTYKWIIRSRGQCSTSCAGGIRKRKVECISSNEETVSDFLCERDEKPEDIETCNTQPCPARWFTGEWSSCSKSCGTGERVRRVHCIREVKNAEIEMLPFSDCNGIEPSKVESCVVKKVCPLWKAHEWSECSKSCGPGFRTRKVQCVGKSDFDLTNTLEEQMCDETIKPTIREPCDLGSCNLTWAIGPWSECSAHCGVGMKNRQITCQNSKKRVFPDGFCDKTFRPQSTEECRVAGPCLPMWYATQWSKCSRKCGFGIQMRMIYCASKEGKDLRIIADSNCKKNEKPIKMRNCHQLKPCIAQYFASSWRPCSASCNGGLRFRKVRCYADTRIDYSEKSCIHLTKPASVEICNRQACDAQIKMPGDKDKDRQAITSTQAPRKTTEPKITTEEIETTTAEVTTAPVTTIITTEKTTQRPTTVKVTVPTTQRSIPAMVINFQGPDVVDEGDPADYYCNAGGEPSPEITWRLNGKDIKNLGSRFLLLNRNTHLLITRTSTSDAGKIVCSAVNVGGSDSKSINLQVSSAPKVTVIPASASLKEGDSFFMTCEVTAYPEATVSWKKNGRTFYGDSNTGRVQVTKSMIRFTKLLPADSGNYECIAENSAGFDKRGMALRVKSETKTETCIDDNQRANCQIIKRFNLCGHNFYGQVCCKTCSGNK